MEDLLISIADRISGYREGEIPTPDADHVRRWVSQFDPGVQAAILSELDFVLERTYISRERAARCLRRLIRDQGSDIQSRQEFWKNKRFLDIQATSMSQKATLELFESVLVDELDLTLADCKNTTDFVYLDDVIYTGARVINDVKAWAEIANQPDAKLLVFAIADYALARWRIERDLNGDFTGTGLRLGTRVMSCVTYESRKARKDSSDVLWPCALPAGDATDAYLAEISDSPFTPRIAGLVSKNGIYSGEEGRSILETEFFLAGLNIRSFAQNPSPWMRPLGNYNFGLGFGAMTVTYRNCPNNAPLALWYGDITGEMKGPLGKWYPLFPRKSNYGGRDREFATEVIDDLPF